MSLVEQPNVNNPATAESWKPLHALWTAWFGRLATRLNWFHGQISTPAEYADNATAVAAGLVPGEFYRTGDALKVVHT
jgi:hypothetical protein